MPNTVIEAQATGLPCVIADTITKEANVTGIVTYISLNSSCEEWADAVLIIGDERYDTQSIMIEKGYDIESSARKFVEIIFKK